MKHLLKFYKRHKLAAFFTFMWFIFMAYITITGLRGGNAQDFIEVGSGIFAGIVMFVPVALIIAILSAMLSKIFGTLREIIHINGTDNDNSVDPVIPEYNYHPQDSQYIYQEKTIIPTPETFPEPVPEPEPEVPQLPVYDTMEGHDFEYYCADLLCNDGFYNVEVTQGSGDQGIDILAEKAGIRYGIQCKCYSNNIGNKAVQEAFAGKAFYHCHVAAVLTNRYFTRSAKELAEKDQVLLWDRDELERLVQNAES
nr:MAG TPA: Restriction endonuclease [Caudoviricetes sp.]